MTKAIENVVAHFDSQEIKKIEVKEWGTEDQPLEIFTKPQNPKTPKPQRFEFSILDSKLEISIKVFLL